MLRLNTDLFGMQKAFESRPPVPCSDDFVGVNYTLKDFMEAIENPDKTLAVTGPILDPPNRNGDTENSPAMLLRKRCGISDAEWPQGRL